MFKIRGVVQHEAVDDTAQGEGTGGEETQSRDYEADAANMGWVPQDKWTQDPKRWVDAKTFIERGEHVLPIVLAQKRELEARVKELQKGQQELDADVRQFREMTERQLKTEYEAKLRDALERRQAAITEQDGEAFNEADLEVAKLRAEAAAPKETKAAPPVHPDYAPWLEQNQWYATDEELQLDANIIGARLVKRNPTLQGKSLYEAVAAEVKKRNPDKFSTTGSRGSVVETTGNRGDLSRSGPAGRKTYDDLPDEAKKACDRFITKGWITTGKTTAEKRQAYVDTYQFD